MEAYVRISCLDLVHDTSQNFLKATVGRYPHFGFSWVSPFKVFGGGISRQSATFPKPRLASGRLHKGAFN